MNIKDNLFIIKNMPLFLQIWLIFGLIMAISFILAAILIPISLRDFINNQALKIIRDTQNSILQNDLEIEVSERFNLDQEQFYNPYHDDNYSVQHLIVTRNDLLQNDITSPFLENLKRTALQQQEEVESYSLFEGKKRLFLVIRKITINQESAYFISYIGGNYGLQVLDVLFKRMLLIIGFVLLVSWVFSIYLTRYISAPLVKLKEFLRRIANRDWSSAVQLEQKGEIGELAETVEWMREKLVEYDEKQQTFLQEISHELKTPIMIIRSYARSIQDGIFPEGSLARSVQIIDEEGERIEKRVRSLLNLFKLDYYENHELERELFDFKGLVNQVVDKYKWRAPKINWNLNLEAVELEANREQLAIVMENLIDNQIRYAANEIRISLSSVDKNNAEFVKVRVWNDGPEIDPAISDQLFTKFKKDKKGEFGLGLAIVKRIVKMHNGEVWIKNENGGVAFYLQIPYYM